MEMQLEGSKTFETEEIIQELCFHSIDYEFSPEAEQAAQKAKALREELKKELTNEQMRKVNKILELRNEENTEVMDQKYSMGFKQGAKFVFDLLKE